MNPIRQYRKKPVVITAWQTDIDLYIKTLEGEMHASPGDWIITGVNGEQYPCKPDIFEKTYEPADLEPTPDARDLAEEINQDIDDWYSSDDYPDDKTVVDRATSRIAAHDARLLDEAAERGVKWLLDGFADEWLSDDAEKTLRAAIKGAAHE